MAQTLVRIRPDTQAVAAVAGLPDDMDFSATLKAQRQGAARAGMREPLSTTLRVMGAMKALSDAGLYADLSLALAPDIVRREGGAVAGLFDLGPYGVRFDRRTEAAIPVIAAGNPARSVLDLTASATQRLTSVATPDYPVIRPLPQADLVGRAGWTVMVPIRYPTGIGTAESYFLTLAIGSTTMLGVGRKSGGAGVVCRAARSGTAISAYGAPPGTNWFVLEAVFDTAAGTLTIYNGATQIAQATFAAQATITTNATDTITATVGSTSAPLAHVSDMWKWSRALTAAERATARAAMRSINPQVP